VVVSPGAAVARGVIVDQAAAGDLCEGSVACISEQEILYPGPVGLAVRHKKIEITIIIEVGPGATPRIAHLLPDPTVRDQGECSVALIVVQKTFLAEVGDKQIQITIVIVITPGATGRISDIGDDRVAGDF